MGNESNRDQCKSQKDKGNTAAILTPFLEGIKKAGAEVEVYYTSKMR